MKKTLSALAFLSMASFTQAACLDWNDTDPSIPAGDTATFDEMYKTQQEVKEFIKEGMEELEEYFLPWAQAAINSML